MLQLAKVEAAFEIYITVFPTNVSHFTAGGSDKVQMCSGKVFGGLGIWSRKG